MRSVVTLCVHTEQLDAFFCAYMSACMHACLPACTLTACRLAESRRPLGVLMIVTLLPITADAMNDDSYDL